MKNAGLQKRISALLAVVFGLILAVSLVPANAAPKPSLPGNPLVLKVAIYSGPPEANTWTLANVWIMREVEKRSQGRIKFEYYYNGSLVPAKEVATGLKTGVADLAFLNQSYAPGKLPLMNVTTLPVTGQYYYSSCMALAELTETPELKAEFDMNNIRYLSPLAVSSYGIWSRFPVRTIKDLKGKKIVATGEHSRVAKAIGAVPVSIVATEIYTALERKTVDGALANPTYAYTYKWPEICAYYYRLLFGTKAQCVAINKDSWNKVPADIQKLFIDLREEAAKQAHEIYEGAGERQLAEGVRKGGVTVTEPSKEDVAFLQKMAKEVVWKDWIEAMDKKGLPGKKVLDDYLKLIEKWEARSPFKK